MSRAVYNTTCDFYRGPAPVVGAPNALYRNDVPCRLVVYDKIYPRSSPFDYETAWLTHPLPHVAIGIPDFILINYIAQDFDQFDRIVVASDPATTYLAWRPEECLVGTITRYSRCRLIPLPYPW